MAVVRASVSSRSGTIVGKWSQGTPNTEILVDYYIALTFLNEITVRAKVSRKDFYRPSRGQTIPMRYLPTEPTYCAMGQSMF